MIDFDDLPDSREVPHQCSRCGAWHHAEELDAVTWNHQAGLMCQDCLRQFTPAQQSVMRTRPYDYLPGGEPTQ